MSFRTVSLRYDEYYFSSLGDVSLKASYFRSFLAMMKKKRKEFKKLYKVKGKEFPLTGNSKSYHA